MLGEFAAQGDAASPGEAAAGRADAPGDAIGTLVKQFERKASQFDNFVRIQSWKTLSISPGDVTPRSCQAEEVDITEMVQQE